MIAVALGVLVLWGAVAISYGRVLDAPFIFDDAATILSNPSITRLWPLFGDDGHDGPLRPTPNRPTSARPLVNLSFAINYYFGRFEPAGYRGVNIGLHALSALLLWAIVYRTLRLERFQPRFGGAEGIVAFAAALVWAVHPLNTESVAYVTQRTESMMAFFYLATLYASIRYWAADCRFGRIAWLVLAIVSGALGMLCKEMMASAIAMVLLYEWMFISGSLGRALRRSWPLYVGLALGWLPIVAINYHGPRTPLAGFHLGVPAHVWWLTQTEVLLRFIGLAFWPWPLVIHYEVPYLRTLGDAWPWAVPAAIGIVGCAWLVWRGSAIGYVGVWVLAVLSPTLLIPLPGETMAERRMYLPLATIVPLVASGIYAAMRWLAGRMAARGGKPLAPRVALTATMCATCILSVILGAVTTVRLGAYRDEVSIWQDAVIHQPHDPLVQVNLGTSLAKVGRQQEAMQHLEEALQLDPDPAHDHFSHAHFNLGKALAELGRPDEALAHYELAVKSSPNFADAEYNLGLALSEAGRTSEAIDHFAKAVRIRPDFPAAHNNLAIALASTGKAADAIPHFEEALKSEPDSEGYANLAFAYALAGKAPQAIATAQKAVELARAQNKSSLADEIDAWLRSYRARFVPRN